MNNLRLPQNPNITRVQKSLAAASDARKGKPAGPVHPAQGPPCDRVYARQYLAVRTAVLMTADERQALFEAEQEYADALADMDDAKRRAKAARERIVGLVAPGE